MLVGTRFLWRGDGAVQDDAVELEAEWVRFKLGLEFPILLSQGGWVEFSLFRYSLSEPPESSLVLKLLQEASQPGVSQEASQSGVSQEASQSGASLEAE